MILFYSILTLTVAVLAIILTLYVINKLPVNNKLVGQLNGDTAISQTYEIFLKVLDNESLFELVKDNGVSFSGHELYDSEGINTSKFVKLVLETSTIPMQFTSAERYLRLFKEELYHNNSKVNH